MKIKNIWKPPPSRDYIFKFATGEGGEITFFILFLSPSKGQESGYFLNTFRFQHLNPDKNTELYPKFKLIPMHPQKWLRDVLLNLRFVCFFSCFFFGIYSTGTSGGHRRAIPDVPLSLQHVDSCIGSPPPPGDQFCDSVMVIPCRFLVGS